MRKRIAKQMTLSLPKDTVKKLKQAGKRGTRVSSRSGGEDDSVAGVTARANEKVLRRNFGEFVAKLAHFKAAYVGMKDPDYVNELCELNPSGGFKLRA